MLLTENELEKSVFTVLSAWKYTLVHRVARSLCSLHSAFTPAGLDPGLQAGSGSWKPQCGQKASQAGAGLQD